MLKSLRSRLTIGLIIISLLPLVVSSFMIAMVGYSTLQQQAIVLQDEVAKRVASEIDAFMLGLEDELSYLVEIQQLQRLSNTTQRDVLNRVLANQQAFTELSLLDHNGQEVVRVSNLSTTTQLINRSDEELFAFPQETNTVYYSPVRFNEEAREPQVTIALPVENLRSGQVEHVLVADISFKAIWDLLAGLDFADESDVYVVGSDDLVIAHKNPSVVLRETTIDLPDEGMRYTGLNGNDVVMAVQALQYGNQTYVVAAEISYVQATALATNNLRIAIVAALIGLVIALVCVFVTNRYVVNPIECLSEVARAIRGGDFSREVDIQREDEIGDLAYAFTDMTTSLQQMIDDERTSKERLEKTVASYMAFVQDIEDGNLGAELHMDEAVLESQDETDLLALGRNLISMVDSLRIMTLQIREASQSVNSAAQEILVTTTQQIATATEQDAAVTQTAASIEEVQATVNQTAVRAHNVAEMAMQSVEVSLAGQQAVQDTVQGVSMVRERVEDIARSILALSERTQQIGEITNSVNDIAEQSKLLALNASIEAARAGEEGRGFAVVALEVRQLAEQSQGATEQIGSLLGEIQTLTNQAVMVTEEGSKGADIGVSLVDKAGIAIRDLTSVIENSARSAEQIASSTGQQINGMSQLLTAIQAIKQSTIQTAAATKQAEHSARELNNLASEMEAAITRYQLA